METIAENLISWYEKNKRSLPWRETKNPYFIWISEIMLQQTRVEAVKVYYKNFIEHLPTLKDLAEIKEDDLLKLWEGLGYYSRVRNMQKTAKLLIEEGKETLPNTKEELLLLPGIGKYTAGAILSIAFDKPSIALDGNVYRVLGRYYAIDSPINKSSSYSIYEKKMKKILPSKNASSFTQSFMDFGSMICTPKSPKCDICPLKDKCKARKIDKVENYPVKEKKKTQRAEELSVYILVCKDKIAIRKRDKSGLLASLYEFPNDKETSNLIDVENSLIEHNIDYQYVQEIGESKHIFSHIIWYMRGYLVVLKEPIAGYQWVTVDELKSKYSIPSAFAYYYNYIIDRKGEEML